MNKSATNPMNNSANNSMNDGRNNSMNEGRSNSINGGRNNSINGGRNNSMNNSAEAMALMKAIQSLAFAKVEAELFLDTHPECRQALEYYKEVVNNLKEATAEYSAKYGPICATDVQGDRWTWTDGQWPWHMTGKED